jgi:hypothetical protein
MRSGRSGGGSRDKSRPRRATCLCYGCGAARPTWICRGGAGAGCRFGRRGGHAAVRPAGPGPPAAGYWPAGAFGLRAGPRRGLVEFRGGDDGRFLEVSWPWGGGGGRSGADRAPERLGAGSAEPDAAADQADATPGSPGSGRARASSCEASGRIRQGLPLAALRAHGELVELRAAELALTAGPRAAPARTRPVSGAGWRPSPTRRGTQT